MKEIPLHRLDRTSLDYLRQIEATDGSASNGVFVRLQEKQASPRANSHLLLLAGVVTTALVLVSGLLLDFEAVSPRVAGYFQAGFLAVGLWLIVRGSLGLFGGSSGPSLGAFHWVDARHVWQVTPEKVRVLPVDQLTRVETRFNCAYLSTSARVERVELPSADVASRLAEFLSAVQELREESKQSSVGADTVPELLGALALQITRVGQAGVTNLRLEDLKPGLPLPAPEEVAGTEPAGPTPAHRLLPWGVAAVLGLAALFLLPARNEAAREQRLYDATVEARPGEEEPFQRYLSVYPAGLRTEEVREAFEDNQARHAAASPPGNEARYERYFKLFPQGRLADKVRAGHEDHLYRYALASAPGHEERYQRCLQRFPQGHLTDQVRNAFEDNLADHALASPPGLEDRYERYLKVFPQGRRAEQVRLGYEEHLFRFAQDSPVGKEDRYLRCLERFPNGKLTAQVRTSYEDHLHNAARASAAGAEGAYRRYLEVFPKGRHADAVRAAFEENLFKATVAAKPGEEKPFERYLAVFPEGGRVKQVREAFEDNLAGHASSSPPEVEERYLRYFAHFPRGRMSARLRAEHEEHLYRWAKESPGDEDRRIRRYLDVFPAGRFAAQLKELLDNNRFATATSRAGGKDPAPLRRYLTDKDNTRHREAAQKQIDGLYDRAIADLKKRGAGTTKPADRPLFESIVNLLEALKRADSSVVTVGFNATQVEDPEAGIAKTAEEIAYKAHLMEHAELKTIEREKGSAILPRGQVFGTDQTTRREQIAFDRLRTAVEKVLEPTLLKLVPADRGGTPMLEVGYRVFAPGGLFVFTQTLVRLRNGVAEGREVRIRGLLRRYDVEWTIRTRPPGSDKPHEYRFRSTPEDSIGYREAHGDPDWAPYAILLYSAFEDMSRRLQRSFGFDPGEAPKSLSFEDSTGIKPPPRRNPLDDIESLRRRNPFDGDND